MADYLNTHTSLLPKFRCTTSFNLRDLRVHTDRNDYIDSTADAVYEYSHFEDCHACFDAVNEYEQLPSKDISIL